MTSNLIEYTHELKGYQILNYEFSEDDVIVHISREPELFSCPSCSSSNVNATRVDVRQIKCLPIGSKQTRFKVYMHRLTCRDCKAYRMEEVDFIESTHNRSSKLLDRYVIELRNHMTIKAVAKHYDLHWSTVKNIEKRHLREKYKEIILSEVTAIGIDEVFMGKKLGDKGFLTIVRDLDSGAVLFVGKGKKGECLDPFAKKLLDAETQLKYVAVDLAPSFTSWIHSNFPEATIVYDHFHVIKLMNDKVSNIRRRIMNELETEDKAELKGMRWHFNLNNENLSETAQVELQSCCKLFEELGMSYSLKEALRRIYNLKNVEFAETALVYWCEKAGQSGIKEMMTMAKTIRKHGPGILAFWETGITSAGMEGFNNKIGWLNRQAYGYRDEEYLILKIFDLPNLKVTKEL